MRICLVSDFFYPSLGGIETHIWQLGQCLMERGHVVIVVTHAYGNRVGIRFMSAGLKVYYLPIVPFYNNAILPTIFCSVPSLRHIFVTERIDVVHGHGAFSSLAHEALFIGEMMNKATAFTDHSLFGFADASAIVTNHFLKFSLCNVGRCICVSHIGKVNTMRRAEIAPKKVYVIPNAVDADVFLPDFKRKSPRKDGIIVVAIGSRLVLRKGIDLIAAIIPRICKRKFSKDCRVDFLIGGDGPKRIILEEMIERNSLEERVRMLGELQHAQVRDELLVKADLFLNTSLTEAFCMAILEAASCGLPSVCTRVGGCPEVLREDFVRFVEPDVNSIEEGLIEAVEKLIRGGWPSKRDFNDFVRDSYDWRDVAMRTEKVYKCILEEGPKPLQEKVANLWRRGSVAGPTMAVVFLFCYYWILFLNFWLGEKL